MALCTSLSLSILGPPFLVAFAAAGSFSFAIPPYIACVCFRVWATIPFIPTSFPFVWAAPGCSLIPLVFRGGGGLFFFIWSLAVSTFGRWRLPLLLLAYRARKEGGFHDICSVGGCAGVAALCASFFLSVLGPSSLVSFAAVGSGLSIPCLCLLARVGVPLALFVPWGLWFVCLVAVVCAPR